ncbi:hypothetical protein Efla_001994 [Eimeria flavescens]
MESFKVALTYHVSVERVAQVTMECTYTSAAATTTKQVSVPLNSTAKQQLSSRSSHLVVSGPKGLPLRVQGSSLRPQMERLRANGKGTSATCRRVEGGWRRLRPPPLNQLRWRSLTVSCLSSDLLKSEFAVQRASTNASLNWAATSGCYIEAAIGLISCEFLDEREKHDPSDPSLEMKVKQPLIQVYKYISPNSPVVIVKAYATFGGSSLSIVGRTLTGTPMRRPLAYEDCTRPMN